MKLPFVSRRKYESALEKISALELIANGLMWDNKTIQEKLAASAKSVKQLKEIATMLRDSSQARSYHLIPKYSGALDALKKLEKEGL